MKRFDLLSAVLAAVFTLLLPFIGGGESAAAGVVSSASAVGSTEPTYASSIVTSASAAPTGPSKLFHRSELARAGAAAAAHPGVDTGQPGQKSEPIPVVVAPPVDPPATDKPVDKPAVPAGTSSTGGSTAVSSTAVPALNSIRAANCLQPIAAQNFRSDSCMEQRLYWMAEDPSTNTLNTWGHTGVRSLALDASGVYYSNSVPSKGCDGNLAGGPGNTGATVAQKWWDSLMHRASLYRPSVTSTAGVCIYCAMTHGGLPSENAGFARAAACWGGC